MMDDKTKRNQQEAEWLRIINSMGGDEYKRARDVYLSKEDRIFLMFGKAVYVYAHVCAWAIAGIAAAVMVGECLR